MPYITQARRDELAGQFKSMHAIAKPLVAGELNYLITMLLIEYLDSHAYNYQTINDVVGALESAKAEFQRRIVGPYEDKKIKDNGDVYA